MFKLILIGLTAYIAYSLYLRYTNKDKIHKSSKSNTSKKYSKMNISDAEFKDIDEE